MELHKHVHRLRKENALLRKAYAIEEEEEDTRKDTWDEPTRTPSSPQRSFSTKDFEAQHLQELRQQQELALAQQRAARAFQREQMGLSQRIGSGVSDSVGAVLSSKPVRLLGEGAFLLIVGSIGLFVILAFWIGMYMVHADTCEEFRPDGVQGFTQLRTEFFTGSFQGCLFRSTWHGFMRYISLSAVPKVATDFFNHMVYRATGDYHYAVVDQHAQEPVGVFIERLDARNRYETHLGIDISASIVVKSLGESVSGTVYATLDGEPCDTQIPADHRFYAGVSMSEPFLCSFRPHRFDSSKTTDFILRASFDYSTFAYMVPTFVTSSAWFQLNENQQHELNRNSQQGFLKTVNAPVQIGGSISGGNDIVVVDDRDGSLVYQTVLGVTFHADKQHSGGRGKLSRVNTAYIVMPSSLRLVDDHDGIGRCGAYAFEQIQCSDATFGSQDYDYLCEQDDHVYSLKTGYDDTSGSFYQEIENIETFHTVNCPVYVDRELLFTESGEAVAVQNVPIKIYASYVYEISRSMPVSLVKRFQDSVASMRTYTCPAELQELAIQGQPIADPILQAYATRYQPLVTRHISQSLTFSDRIRLEALVAAAAEAHSQFGLRGSDGASSIAGCISAPSVDAEADLRCATQTMSRHLSEEAVSDILTAYYAELESRYQGSSIAQATTDMYVNWIRSLCRIDSSLNTPQQGSHETAEVHETANTDSVQSENTQSENTQLEDTQNSSAGDVA